ncbi:MAG: ATP-binding cassette domain-containing protein [Candidatus Heimdallarchaeota archaeon]|nr:ATP-binding cassette domain-containing protein [Candidatus Heimdallarchaeota archaeon]
MDKYTLLLHQYKFEEIFKALIEVDDLFEIYYVKSRVYLKQKAYEEAISYLMECERLVQSTGEIFNELKVIELSIDIFKQFMKHDHYHRSMGELEKYLRIISFFENRLTEDEKIIYFQIKIHYLELRIKDTGKQYSEEVLELIKEIQLTATGLPGIAKKYEIHMACRQKQKNEKYDSVDNLDSFSIYEKSEILLELGKYHIEFEQYELAKKFLDMGHDLSEKNKFLDLLLLFKEHLAQISYYLKFGMEKSTELYNQYSSFKTQLLNMPFVSEYPVRRKKPEKVMFEGIDLFNKHFDIVNNIVIGEHELVVFRGPASSGKSTMLRYLLGFDHPQSGEILFGSQPLGDLQVKEMTLLRGEKMAFVIEGAIMIPSQSTKMPANEETLNFHLMKYDEKTRADILQLFNRLQATNAHYNAFFIDLLALFKDPPEVVFLDEPFAEMPEQIMEIFMSLLGCVHKLRHCTIIMETHHELISKYADCQYFLREGKIVTILDRV